MNDWHYSSVFLDAATLKKADETLTTHELARRLSEAIVDVVQAQKAAGRELVSMDFDAGKVTIRFREPKQEGKTHGLS